MKRILLLGWVLLMAGSSPAAEWYETLRPGVTRAEVLKLAGKPTSSAAGVDIYTQPKGRIECKYRDGVLESAVCYDPPGGGVCWTLYSANGELKEADLKQRAVYLRSKRFVELPKFSGRTVYTRKYYGCCYETESGFIVIEPIIGLLGGGGYFSDKAARVLLAKTDGTEEVLYRAADHWGKLKPPGITADEVRQRESKLRKAGVRAVGAPVDELLGKADSVMGSGISYLLFYLNDGLIIVRCRHPAETIASVEIVRPGLKHLTLDEWLAGNRSDVKSHSIPQQR